MKVGFPPLLRDERGFSYLMVMIAIVVIGIVMSVAARQWKVMVQRELEADLLAKGIEIQNALAFYSASMKAGRVTPGEVYPQTLADLTRLPKPFLRKVYGDPVGHGEWEVVRAPTGGIMGVRSKSKSKPIRQQNFPLVVRHFQGKSTYYDWVFQHPSPSGTVVNPLGIRPQTVVPGPPGTPGVPGSPTQPAATGTPDPPVTSPPPTS
jgi:type II secretory pathway pseudopilin PulG